MGLQVASDLFSANVTAVTASLTHRHVNIGSYGKLWPHNTMGR